MIRENFNAGWQVEKGSGKARMNSFLNQSAAKAVHLPYDAMVHEPRDPAAPSGAQTGFYPGGEYIYQKTFAAPADWRGKPVFLAFEGIYQTAMVYVNGTFACKSVNGYADFTVDLTPYLQYGAENRVKVIADNSRQPNSRWYTGSGMYRGVKLLVGNRAYLCADGVRVTTRELGTDFAGLEAAVRIKSASPVTERLTLRHAVRFAEEIVLQDSQRVILYPGAEQCVTFRYDLEQPALWSTGQPNLYTSVARLYDGETLLDQAVDRFGVRTVAVDAVHGLRINGEAVKLRGACIHHDNGILGATTLEAAENYRCKRLKAAGFNAIRSAHHPAGRALLDACDRYGILVMDELSDVWNVRKNPYDYALEFAGDWERTAEKMVAKDYNHPSVILYCVGNEIPEAGTEAGAATNRALCNAFRTLDPTRFTTNALNGLMAAGSRLPAIMQDMAEHFDTQTAGAGGNAAGSNAINSFMSMMEGERGDYFSTHPLLSEALSGCSESADIIGLNYLTGRHLLEHTLHPHKAVIGTETYPADIVRLWKIVTENPHVLGDFTWAGYDYLGEAGCGIFHYDGSENFTSIFPERAAYIGDMDLIGSRRPISYYREIIYGLRKAPYLAVGRMNRTGQTGSKTPWMFKDNLASWTWPGWEGQTAAVEVYAASEEVELFLNGSSLGRKPVTDFAAAYAVPYLPGSLRAVGYTAGRPDGDCTLQTAAQSVLTLTPDRTELAANGEDLCFCLIHFTDADGQENPAARHTLSVRVEGAGALEALGSANPSSEERYDAPESETYDGQCLAVLRAGEAPGCLRVIVTADGREQKEFTLAVR